MNWYKKVINGERKGIGAGVVRVLLSGLAVIYGLIIRLRNGLYDIGLLKISTLPIPVICIGNITAGGTGKTPMVVWLCKYLKSQGKSIVLLTRGYKSQEGSDDNDEVRLIRSTLPDMPVVVDSDRVRGGKSAIEQYHPDVIVMDDGFQHRRLGRDIDIVMIDCSCPFGYGAILPRGLLRESISQLKRADGVVLSRSDVIDMAELDALENRIESLVQVENNESKPMARCCHQPVSLQGRDGQEIDLNELKGKRVIAFCGIGNPESFVTLLRKSGAEVVGERFYPDHVHYDDILVGDLADYAQGINHDWCVTTEKDWVKLGKLAIVSKMRHLYCLNIEISITRGEEQLTQRIDELWYHPQEKNTDRSTSVS